MISLVEKKTLMRKSPSSENVFARRPSNVKHSGMRKAMSCSNLLSKDDPNNQTSVRKSFSIENLETHRDKVVDPVHTFLAKHKRTFSDVVKANAPGVLYDITKEAFFDKQDIQSYVAEHLAKDSFVSTVSHIIHHHM